MPSDAKAPVRVFISYSHKDDKLREQLNAHLGLLKNEGVIDDWHDRGITAGQEWADAIDEQLNSAAIILLLISADFLASKYCYQLEMTRALKRHADREARVIPVILRPVDWQKAPFGNLQALPKDGKPVTDWTSRDKAFKDVAQGIRRAVEEIRDDAPGSKTIVIGAGTPDLDDACRTLAQRLQTSLEDQLLADQATARSVARDNFIATDLEQVPDLLTGANLLILPFSGAKIFQRDHPGGHLALQHQHRPQGCEVIWWRAPGGRGLDAASGNGLPAVEDNDKHRPFLEQLFAKAREEEDAARLVERIVAWLKGDMPLPENAKPVAAIAWEKNEPTAEWIKWIKGIAEQRCGQLNCGCELFGESLIPAKLFDMGSLGENYQGVVLNGYGKEVEHIIFAKRRLESRFGKELKIAAVFFDVPKELPMDDCFGVTEGQDKQLEFSPEEELHREFDDLIKQVAAIAVNGR